MITLVTVDAAGQERRSGCEEDGEIRKQVVSLGSLVKSRDDMTEKWMPRFAGHHIGSDTYRLGGYQDNGVVVVYFPEERSYVSLAFNVHVDVEAPVVKHQEVLGRVHPLYVVLV